MKNIYKNVEITSEGYYKLLPKYRKELEYFYQEEYYKNNGSLYQTKYDVEELEYFENLSREKDWIFQKLRPLRGGNILDIGCGEGYLLKTFSNLGYNVSGVDFGKWAVKHHNPEVADKVIEGDLYKVIDDFIQKGKKFDYIVSDNVLEHVRDEEEFFNKIKGICHEETLVSIRVPNDFSLIQKYLFEHKKIDKAFWVTETTGEHNYYFTMHSLIKLGEKMGFIPLEAYSDFPIDYFLMNDDTNYIMKQGVGYNCYLAKIKIENMIYSQSIEKAFNLHKSYGEIGVGRNIVVIFKVK